jgi:hypothetical protein
MKSTAKANPISAKKVGGGAPPPYRVIGRDGLPPVPEKARTGTWVNGLYLSFKPIQTDAISGVSFDCDAEQGNKISFGHQSSEAPDGSTE